MSADFFSFAFAMSEGAAAPLVQLLADTEVEYNGNIFCDVGVEAFDDVLKDASRLTMCPNFPAFVAIDRFVAQPGGRHFLGGHAYRWVPPDEVAGLAATVDALAVSDLTRAFAMVERGWNAIEDIQAAFVVLVRAYEQAKRQGHGVLLACIPM